MPDADPYRYFRIEARELIDQHSRGLLALERGDPEGRVVPLLRAAHTLKGAARVVGATHAADAAHRLEEALEGLSAESGSIEGALAALDAIVAAVRALGGAPSGAASEAPASEQAPSSPRADGPMLDALEERLIRAGVQLRAVREELERPAIRALGRELQRLHERVDRLARDLEEAGELARGMRMLPIAVVVPALERSLRDACVVTDRRARLATLGTEHRIDGTLLEGLREALDHVVRNAVVHGIEPPDERLAAGKPAEGRVELCVERRGGTLRITCADDGRGLDLGAVRDRAAGDPWQAIFQPRVTTATEVSSVSGRGMGLDAVAQRIAELGGRARALPSDTGGLAIELIVPIGRLAMRVLRVRAGGHRAAVPLDAVVRALPLDEAVEELIVDGQPAPVVPLSALFRGGSQAAPRFGVQLRAGRGAIVLAVEELGDVLDAVARPVCAAAGRLPGVSALLVDADGAPVPIVDPGDLEALRGRGGAAPAAEPRDDRLPILVVDDSLTTRMLERSILETAGYEVHTASSGEEALQLAARQDYALFVVDVQMPGMDGVAFVRATRADARLGRVPAILVTSLASPADRQRGLEAGADAYVVKREFDQRAFLGLVATLAGAP